MGDYRMRDFNKWYNNYSFDLIESVRGAATLAWFASKSVLWEKVKCKNCRYKRDDKCLMSVSTSHEGKIDDEFGCQYFRRLRNEKT